MKKSNDFMLKHLEENETVILSCSGGPDSMCLLDILFKLKKQLNLKIVVAHINHNQRKESIDEKKFVEEYCKKHDLIFEYLSIEIFQDNFQKDARDKRYNFLENLVTKHNSKTVFTAHHGDDLIETILMRLSRGSKIQGYAGFRAINCVQSYKILRPLIFYNKEDILNYNKENSVLYKIDESNFETNYTRNKYRKNFLPLLKAVDKNIHLQYLNYSEELLKYYDYINKLVLEKNLIKNNKLDLKKIEKEDVFIQDKSIELLLSLFQEKEELEVSNNIINEIKKLINSPNSNISIDLPNNCKCMKSKNTIFIEKQQ